MRGKGNLTERGERRKRKEGKKCFIKQGGEKESQTKCRLHGWRRGKGEKRGWGREALCSLLVSLLSKWSMDGGRRRRRAGAGRAIV